MPFISETYIDKLEDIKEKAKEKSKEYADRSLKYVEKGLDYAEKTEGGQSYKAQKAIFEPLKKVKKYLEDKQVEKK